MTDVTASPPKDHVCAYSFVSDLIEAEKKKITDTVDAKSAPTKSATQVINAERVRAFDELQAVCDECNVVYVAQFLTLGAVDFSRHPKAFSSFSTLKKEVERGMNGKRLRPVTKETLGAVREGKEDPEPNPGKKKPFVMVSVFPRNPVDAIMKIARAHADPTTKELMHWPAGLMRQTIDRRFPSSNYFKATFTPAFYRENREAFAAMGLKHSASVRFSDEIAKVSRVRYYLSTMFDKSVEKALRLGLQQDPDKQDASLEQHALPLIVDVSEEGASFLRENFTESAIAKIKKEITRALSDPAVGPHLLELMEARRKEDIPARSL